MPYDTTHSTLDDTALSISEFNAAWSPSDRQDMLTGDFLRNSLLKGLAGGILLQLNEWMSDKLLASRPKEHVSKETHHRISLYKDLDMGHRPIYNVQYEPHENSVVTNKHLNSASKRVCYTDADTRFKADDVVKKAKLEVCITKTFNHFDVAISSNNNFYDYAGKKLVFNSFKHSILNEITVPGPTYGIAIYSTNEKLNLVPALLQITSKKIELMTDLSALQALTDVNEVVLRNVQFTLSVVSDTEF